MKSDITDKDTITSNDGKLVPDSKNNVAFCMIIDILTEIVLHHVRGDVVINQDTSDLVKSVQDVFFQSVIGRYTLNFKQSVAFEMFLKMCWNHFLKEIKMKGFKMQNHCQV